MSGSPRVGVAGTGKIIPESVAAMQETGYEIVSIWGPHPEKAAPLADRFGIERVCGSYDELLSSKIDFVYIALVNSVHFDYARRALEGGVNVLLEKPFCSVSEEASILKDLAESKGLYIFETISNIYLPAWRSVKNNLEGIGRIKLFQADFSQYSSRYYDYLKGRIFPSFNPDADGGSLRDLNVYNLHLSVDLLGNPVEVTARYNRGHNGVDTSSAVILSYPEALAVCTAAKDSGNPSRVIIQGENGWILLPGMPNNLPSVEISIRGGENVVLNPNCYGNRLSHAYEFFRDCFLNRRYEEMLRYLDHSLMVMDALDRCRGSNYPIT